MSKRFVVFCVMFVSVVMLSVPCASGEQTITTEDFQDLCASAPASKVIQALEQMNGMALDIAALTSASVQNPDARVTTVLIDAIRTRATDIALDKNGTTALMYAAESNTPEVVKAIVDAGADVNIRDTSGKKALDYALKNEKIVDNTEVLKMLGYEVPEITPTNHDEDKTAEKTSGDVETTEPELAPIESEDTEPDNVILSDDDGVKPTEFDNPPAPLNVYVSVDVEPSDYRELITSDDVTAKSDDVELGNDASGDIEVAEPAPEPIHDINEPPVYQPMPIPESPQSIDNSVPTPSIPALKPAQESRIMPDEFTRMCSGASSEIILNAVENRNADVNARDYYDVTPLMYAAEKNSDPTVIDILVKHGAKTDAKDRDGKTALMYAAKSNPNSEIISALASNGTNINARDNNRMTALMYAARNNNARVAKALIDAGAEELADKRGWTPLFWAARYTQNPEVIGVLLDAGHDPQIRAHDMATPIDHANKNPRLINTKEFLRLEEESR